MRQTPQRGRLVAFVAFGVALGVASNAAAEPRLGADRAELRRQLVELQRRERALEDKIRRIDAELAREASTRAVASRTVGRAKPAAAVDCVLPYYLDLTGIKHLRPECLEASGQPSCDPPYAVDEQGVRHFRTGCASGVALPSKRADE
jgi:hypothetical protein